MIRIKSKLWLRLNLCSYRAAVHFDCLDLLNENEIQETGLIFNCSICLRPSYLDLIAFNWPLSPGRRLSLFESHYNGMSMCTCIFTPVYNNKGFKSWIPASASDERQTPERLK